MTDHQVIGKVGRVTGTVGPGIIGEVMLSVRGGTEAFHAYPEDDDAEVIPPGTRVIVVDHLPPRTVVVSRSGF